MSSSRAGVTRRALFHHDSKWRADTICGRQSGVVGLEERLVVEGEVGSPETVFEVLRVDEQSTVVGHEAVATLPVVEHERVADEQLAGVLRIDAGVGDHAVDDDGQSEERDAFVRHRRAASGRPVGLVVVSLDQVRRQLLHPLGLDARHGPGEQA